MLNAGTKLGVYEVTAHIGSGGMGEVYQAHDSKLGRDVAIKVLPEQFARHSERLARFQREAKMLAALNHPNIAAIYGLEQSGETHYLVMELVPGQTLAERIRSGAIPVDEALPIARQVADAVEYAHDKNVIHRDLKPANIKVTPDGKVKVLDFGLARAMSQDVSEGDMSNSPTLSMAATQQGVILGTAAYMSPEQAKGKTVDRRADVWAFGVVLYEILTGKQLFSGETVSETMAAVMMKEPALDALPAKTPPAIRDLLRRCLDREVRQRLRDMGEARILIERVLSGAAPAEPSAAPSVRSVGYRTLLIAAGCSLAVGLIAAFVVWNLTRPAPQAVTRFPITLPADQSLVAQGRNVVAISPDGSHIVYTTGEGLRLRSLDRLEATVILNTAGAVDPFFSPDGQWIGFFANEQLKKVSVSGGAPLTLCKAALSLGASWGADDSILYGQGLQGIWKVAGAGGTPEQAIKVGDGEVAYGPQFLPGGGWVLFTLRPKGAQGVGSWDRSQIVAQSVTTGERTVLVNGGRDARYVPSGHLVYALAGSLLAAPFDPDARSVTGGAVPVVEGIADGANGITGTGLYGVAGNGSLVYVPEGATGALVITTQRSLVWVNREGREEPLSAPPRGYVSPRLSPDGTRVAINVRDAASEIWVWDLMRSTLTRLTFDPGQDRFPLWSPDGLRIAFSSQRDGSIGNLFWQLADGTGAVAKLAESESQRQVFSTSFAPDGSRIVVYESPSGTAAGQNDDISVVSLDGQKPGQGAPSRLRPLLHTAFAEALAQVSPDGHWMAYQSDESGQLEIYVRPFPNVDGGRWQVSTGGGTEALWARNGRELFYRNGDSLISVSVRAGSTFATGSPEVVFRGTYVQGYLGGRAYDISLDGRRFLMLKEAANDTATTVAPSIVVVQNWFEELKRRVPAGTR